MDPLFYSFSFDFSLFFLIGECGVVVGHWITAHGSSANEHDDHEKHVCNSEKTTHTEIVDNCFFLFVFSLHNVVSECEFEK